MPANSIGNLVLIPTDFWLQFSSSLLKFSGTATFSDYNKQTCFFLNATDSYSVASDSFCIVASGIPFIVLFNIIISVCGPLAFFIGLINYKHVFYNIVLAKRNLYPTENARVN